MVWWKHRQRRAALGASRLLTLLSLTNSFDRLARFYRTDKSSLGNDYSSHYQRHLGPRRFEELLLLEIGVGGGANRHAGGNSLHLWRDYLPRSTIVGLDLFPKELPFLGRRVYVVQGDQSSPDDLARIVDRFGPPDVVVDDGSHAGSDVIASFEYLFEHMHAGGVYVIEDLFSSYEKRYDGSPDPGPGTALGLLDDSLRSVQHEHGHMIERASLDRPSGQPDGGDGRASRIAGIASIHIYPGIAFIAKAGR
jgi:hypothetical protein